jgi:polyisoprenoid-binding protein YceI
MTTAVEQQLPAAIWNIDTIHSTVSFAVKYMVSTFRSEFDRYEATLDTTGDEPVLKGSVAPDSITVKDPNFHAHLQGPDFFDTERHPAITFESTSFRLDGDELVVDGNLTIKGETRPIEARGELTPVHVGMSGQERIGIQLEASIDRSHFGVSWNAPLPKGGLALANETKLVVDLFFVRS